MTLISALISLFRRPLPVVSLADWLIRSGSIKSR